jgi:hypothetical protein
VRCCRGLHALQTLFEDALDALLVGVHRLAHFKQKAI